MTSPARTPTPTETCPRCGHNYETAPNPTPHKQPQNLNQHGNKTYPEPPKSTASSSEQSSSDLPQPSDSASATGSDT